MGGWRGAGANSLDIRRLQGWEAAKVADRIRRLAASFPRAAAVPVEAAHIAPVNTGTP